MMHRRSLLSWLGVSAAGALNLSAADVTSPKGTGVVALESFGVADAGDLPRLHAYLDGALLPVLQEGRGLPAFSLEAIVAPQTPQVLLVAAFSSFDELLEIRGRIAAQPPVRQARAELETAQVFTEVRSQILTSAPPRLAPGLHTGIFELRSYDAPSWEQGPPAGVAAALARNGIHPMLNAATAAGEHLPRFTYLIPFESLAVRQQAWDRLNADPEWIALQREFAATVTGKSIYRLAPYSRLA